MTSPFHSVGKGVERIASDGPNPDNDGADEIKPITFTEILIGEIPVCRFTIHQGNSDGTDKIVDVPFSDGKVAPMIEASGAYYDAIMAWREAERLDRDGLIPDAQLNTFMRLNSLSRYGLRPDFGSPHLESLDFSRICEVSNVWA